MLCLPTICNHTRIRNLQRVGYYLKGWMHPSWFVTSEWLPISLLWENLLYFPLHSSPLFCHSLHPFQFLPEVCRCYNEWLFLSSFPDRAITWRRNRWGSVGKSTVFSAGQTWSLIFAVGVRSWSKTSSACITGLCRSIPYFRIPLLAYFVLASTSHRIFPSSSCVLDAGEWNFCRPPLEIGNSRYI